MPRRFSKGERVVLLVWHVSGIIGNGGFRYLFEGNLEGDPHFALTAEAFEATGCVKAADAVRKTLALFPDSRPPTNIKERLRYYLSRCKVWPTDMDNQFFAAQEDLRKRLAEYIRSHAFAFAHLETSKAKRPQQPKPPVAERKSRRRKETGPSLENLPHWARVAFAARCARQVFPVLAEHWPGIRPNRSDAVRRAIDLAEQSATQGAAVDGLERAVQNASSVAAAAIATRFVREPIPENAASGTVASFVAKAGANAAESAGANVEDSLAATADAWRFATAAASSADREVLAEELNDCLIKLYHAAIHGKWTNRTKVPSEIWSML